MLFKQAILERIGRGEVKVAFRRWQRPSVQPGTRLHTAVGLLTIESVQPVADSVLTDASARSAGYADLAALQKELRAAGAFTASPSTTPVLTRASPCDRTPRLTTPCWPSLLASMPPPKTVPGRNACCA